MLRHRVAQQISRHSIVMLLRGIRMLREIAVNGTERLRAIIVIRIDHCKGPFHQVTGCQHRMGRAPGLFPTGRDTIAFRQVIQSLISVLHLDPFSNPAAHQLLEVRLNFSFDHKNHRLKAGPPGIIYGIVNDALAMAAYGIHLFQSAVAAAHTSSQHNQDRFLHDVLLHHHSPGRMAPWVQHSILPRKSKRKEDCIFCLFFLRFSVEQQEISVLKSGGAPLRAPPPALCNIISFSPAPAAPAGCPAGD